MYRFCKVSVYKMYIYVFAGARKYVVFFFFFFFFFFLFFFILLQSVFFQHGVPSLLQHNASATAAAQQKADAAFQGAPHSGVVHSAASAPSRIVADFGECARRRRPTLSLRRHARAGSRQRSRRQRRRRRRQRTVLERALGRALGARNAASDAAACGVAAPERPPPPA